MIQLNVFTDVFGVKGWTGWSDIAGTVFKDGCPNPKLNDVQIQAVQEADKVALKAFLPDMTEAFKLILVVDAIRRVRPDIMINLNLPYLPFARQDRVCNEGEANGVAAIAKVINMLEFSAVALLDPHSDVPAGAIARCMIRDLSQVINAPGALGWMNWANTWLVAPDAGAVKRVKALVKKLGAAGMITASKERDPETMELTKIVFDEDPTGKTILVADDLCDGGRTFIGLSKAIKAIGEPKELHLWVTHGIFSYGTEIVTEHFDTVYTTNSFHYEAEGQKDAQGNTNPKMNWVRV